ncbi:LANO_0B02850g1_1 [Lachancea nothofagi CBS 11611]|uniref:LANO_0B02850g1_1 n=1 Tax=Lachancea nothofagi CBS 11611 TaxID=1266666 RepID=A0A1G4IWX4_9SACH|nr:LANO_0B02850g1_1 [Lachancea nothofagi CBS 11611]
MRGSLTCLIIGETPATQFLAWRLSLSNAFIILVSSNISSDGLVSWKSSKLGSNFYRPNEFAKEFDDLESKLTDADGNPRYKIDIMVLSCLSFTSLDRYCDLLSKYSDQNTIVLMNANFGVQLEKLVLDRFFNSSSCILSLLCDVEGRQLSSGSYALVNDSCSFYFGLTYAGKDFTKNTNKNDRLMVNLESVKATFADDNSILNAMISQLQRTNVDEVVKICPSHSFEMALKVWEHIIPRISLNILSVVFEQFDYDKLLTNTSSKRIFQDLVKELVEICFTQCGSVVAKYMVPAFDLNKCTDNLSSQIDFSRVVEETKSRKRQMDRSTINEYPEFLTLSFEAYCFYHRLEFPAHILLHQPILMASNFGINYSSLNFLFGFYSQLLSISGFSIEGGPNKVGPSSLFFGVRTQLANQSEQTLISTDNSPLVGGRITRLRAKLKRRGNHDHSRGTSCDETEDSMLNYAAAEIEDINIDAGNKNSKELDDHDDGIEESGSLKNSRFAFFCDGGIVDSGPEDNDSSSIVDDLIQLPNFQRREFRGGKSEGTFEKNDASATFEHEVRNNPFTMSSRYYFDAYRLGDQDNFMSLKEKRAGNWSRPKLWKLQRQYLVETGQMCGSGVTSSTVPDRFLWDHVNLLRRVNMGGILSVTTSRYGHVDSSQRLFDDWNRGVGPLKRLTLTAPTSATHRTSKDRRLPAHAKPFISDAE